MYVDYDLPMTYNKSGADKWQLSAQQGSGLYYFRFNTNKVVEIILVALIRVK